jgi:hypothetical protein
MKDFCLSPVFFLKSLMDVACHYFLLLIKLEDLFRLLILLKERKLNYHINKTYAYTGIVFGIYSFVINGWFSIYFVVMRAFGSNTNILFMKSFASSEADEDFYNIDIYRKVILTIFDSFIGHFDLIGLKWWAPKQKGIANDTS